MPENAWTREEMAKVKPDWGIAVSTLFIPYEDFCDMRGEEPKPEFLGMSVRVTEGVARLVGDEDDGTEEVPPHHGR